MNEVVYKTTLFPILVLFICKCYMFKTNKKNTSPGERKDTFKAKETKLPMRCVC